MPSPWDVVIIGAGASGLAAAHELSRSDMRVAVLEARSRIGGRIYTHRPLSLSAPVELGAEFIHGKPEITWRMVDQFHLRSCDVPDTHWTGNKPSVEQEEYWKRLDRILSRMRTGGKDRSVDQFLKEDCPDGSSDESADLVCSFIQSFHAADPVKISEQGLAVTIQGSRRTKENKASRLTDGYDTLIRALHKSAKPNLFMETVVTEIEWEPGIVRITAREKGIPLVLEAHHAIVTLPLGVLKAAPGTAGYVRFNPPLRDKQAAGRFLEMGPVCKIILEFSERFWEKSADRVTFFHSPKDAFPVFWTSLPAISPLVVAWTGGPPAIDTANHGLQDMIGAALSGFGKFFGVRREELSQLLVKVHYHDWQNDPFSLGAYSYVTVGGKGAQERLAQPVCDTLFFAGEATDYESQNGTVAGALATGIRAARQILSLESLSRV